MRTGIRYRPEQILGKLREAELEMAKFLNVSQTGKNIGGIETTYYLWWKEQDGLRTDQVKRLKLSEKEITSWRRILVEEELDQAVLMEAARRNF